MEETGCPDNIVLFSVPKSKVEKKELTFLCGILVMVKIGVNIQQEQMLLSESGLSVVSPHHIIVLPCPGFVFI